jgi:DNA-binding LacI/PurR family transcriptional regulator
MSPPRARLKDIAAMTGFSTNTVSLALRKSPLVTEDTRQLIEKAAEEMSYRPNEIAKSLVQRQTRTIGLVLTNIVNPILTQTAQAIETALADRGYSTLFATSTNDREHEIKAIEVFQGRQVDGILIYPTNHSQIDHIKKLRKFHLPVVLLASEPDGGFDVVSLKERLGAYKATRHLIELGHKRIGIIDSGYRVGNPEKLQGYLDALAEANIGRDDRLIVSESGYSPVLGHAGMEALMIAAEPPTAVFASNDAFAFGVLDWCIQHGLDVPGDISVIGFDNIEFSAYAATPLTTVSYDPKLLAQMAVDRLLFLIESGGPETEPLMQHVEPEITVRKSTGQRREPSK